VAVKKFSSLTLLFVLFLAALHHTGKSGEEHAHSCLFVRWDIPPMEGKCCASFYAIGGNQSKGRISVGRFGMKNEKETGCRDTDCSDEDHLGIPVKLFWGNTYNFFGRMN